MIQNRIQKNLTLNVSHIVDVEYLLEAILGAIERRYLKYGEGLHLPILPSSAAVAIILWPLFLTLAREVVFPGIAECNMVGVTPRRVRKAGDTRQALLELMSSRK
jgi:hypothetical protein